MSQSQVDSRRRNRKLRRIMLYVAFFLATLQAVAIHGNIALDLVGASLYAAYRLCSARTVNGGLAVLLYLLLLEMALGGTYNAWAHADFDYLRFVIHFVRLAILMAFFLFLCRDLSPSAIDKNVIYRMILLVGWIQGLYGLYQFFALRHGLPLADLRVLQEGKLAIRDISGVKIYRPYSTFREPSNYGNFLDYWIFFTIAIFKTSRRHKMEAKALLMILVSACLLTLSRGAFIAAAAGFMFVGFSKLREGRAIEYIKLLIGLFAFIALILIVAPPLIDYTLKALSGKGDSSIVTRWSTYTIFLKNMKWWLIGLGLGQFELHYYIYDGVIWGPQSAYVYIISDTGTLGLLLYLLIASRVLLSGGLTRDETVYFKAAIVAGLVQQVSFIGITTAVHWLALAITYSMSVGCKRDENSNWAVLRKTA